MGRPRRESSACIDTFMDPKPAMGREQACSQSRFTRSQLGRSRNDVSSCSGDAYIGFSKFDFCTQLRCPGAKPKCNRQIGKCCKDGLYPQLGALRQPSVASQIWMGEQLLDLKAEMEKPGYSLESRIDTCDSARKANGLGFSVPPTLP